MAGIAGVFGFANAARYLVPMLHGLQHLGRRADIAGFDSVGGLLVTGGSGLVTDCLPEAALRDFSGSMAIGQVSRTGGRYGQNDTQLFAVADHCVVGPFAIVMHGAFVNRAELRLWLNSCGSFSRTDGLSDPEILAELIVRGEGLFLTRLGQALRRVSGAYALVIMSAAERSLYAARDAQGVHALSIAQHKSGGVVVASEDSGFVAVSAVTDRTVPAGTIVSLTEEAGCIRRRTVIFTTDLFPPRPCAHRAVFIPLHTSEDPELGSILQIRQAFGRALAADDTVAGDLAVSVPMSGLAAAHGYAAARGIEYVPAIVRNPYTTGQVVEPDGGLPLFGTRAELGVAASAVRGKSVVLVDDSLLKGEADRHVIALLRERGAREIHLRIAAPPIVAVAVTVIVPPLTVVFTLRNSSGGPS